MTKSAKRIVVPDDIETQVYQKKSAGAGNQKIARDLGISEYKVRTILDPGNQKILFLDIETAPNLGFTWGKYEQTVIDFTKQWYMLSFSVKWLGTRHAEVFSLADFPSFRKDSSDDKALCEKLHGYLDEAQIVCGHNCVEVNTKVLTQDLRWVRAGDLKVGEKLVGFDEGMRPGETLRIGNKWRGDGTKRKIKPAEVTDFTTKKVPCLRVTLSNGDSVITTPDHYWLRKSAKAEHMAWRKSSDLKIGDRMIKFWNVWEDDLSYEAGWLSGFIAGEGTLAQPRPTKPGAVCGFTVSFCQRPGVTWDQALRLCEKLGITLAKNRVLHPSGIGRQDCLYTDMLGGKFKTAETIGKLRIGRFLEKLDWMRFGNLNGKFLPNVSVVKIEDAGICEVAVFSTSTKTFFGGGYAMHNCDRFDIKKVNSRMVLHGLRPPSPYKTVDTLKLARKHFAFTSNKLGDIGSFLGLGEKVETGGFQLWKDCVAGDRAAFRKMAAYNKQDVLLLEKVYLAMRPWATNHPSVTMDSALKCQICGSSNVQYRGYNYSRRGRARRCQCLDCYGWTQGGYQKRYRKP